MKYSARCNEFKRILNQEYRKVHVIFAIAGGGGGVLFYMGCIGMCRCEGYGFQAVYFRIWYINQSVWV